MTSDVFCTFLLHIVEIRWGLQWWQRGAGTSTVDARGLCLCHGLELRRVAATHLCPRSPARASNIWGFHGCHGGSPKTIGLIWFHYWNMVLDDLDDFGEVPQWHSRNPPIYSSVMLEHKRWMGWIWILMKWFTFGYVWRIHIIPCFERWLYLAPQLIYQKVL